MAEAIVGPLLSKLQEVALREGKALAEVGGEIDRLRDKLMWLHAFVYETDLRSRHDGNKLLRVLACQMREVAFEAEDAIDHFSLEADLSRLYWRRAVIKFFAKFHKQISVRYILSRKIKAMNARLEHIVENSGTYAMEHGSTADGKSWRSCQTIPPIRQDWENSVKFCLKCRNNEKKALETKLKNHSGGVVIYVVGDGGIGKRALLKDAYENGTIKEHFHIRIQVSFPEDTSNESIVKQIKDELIMHKKKLHGTTIGKEDIKDLRCLVMIESPVSSTEWAKAERILLAETCRQDAGSKIVLTTTSWNHKTKDNMVEMKHLNDYESKTLFNYFILGPDGHRKSNYKTRQMNLIRSNMEEITGGLPLAVVLLAKLMRTKEYNKWETAFECIRSSDEDDLLKTIVSVSIDDLPDELKSCLLYTSGFPEREVIDAHQLVRLWMAEGFLISQEHRMDMQKLGQRYLAELIYRGLLQPVDRSIHCVDSVSVHDRLQPLLRLEAQRTGFMNVHYGGHAPAPESTRRLALHNDNDKLPSLSNRLRKLRTVVAYYKDGATKAIVLPVPLTSSDDRSARKEKEPRVCKILELLKGSPFLRVIDLEGIDIGPALPSEIGDMVHLEYLGIRCRTLKEVPRSIKNLRKLQTIDVRDTDVKSFPSRLWKIKSLRHVLGHNLYLPESVGDLKLMETLETVRLIYHTDDCRDVATCAGEISLPGLRLLHRLHVVELNEEQADALKALLGEFSCLKSLALSGEVIPMGKLLASEASSASMEHVIPLELYGQLLFDTAPANGIGNGGPFQDLQRCFSNLSRLVLKSTEVDQNFIDVIAEFPLLAELVLLTGSYKQSQLVLCSTGFSSLEVLRLCNLVHLETIILPDNATRQKPIHHEVNKMPNTTVKIQGREQVTEEASPSNLASMLFSSPPAKAAEVNPRSYQRRNTYGSMPRRSPRLAEKKRLRSN